MGRSRDIAKFLSSTEAENTNNNALLHTGSSVGVDSAQVQNIGVASYDTLDSLPISNLVAGQQAFVKDARRLYVSNGSGWFNTAVANATPQWDSGGEPDTEYTIADSATPLIITARAIDSDNSNKNLLNQSFGTDSAQYMVEISNDSSVFTFTPKSADSIGQEVAAGNLTDSNGDFIYTFKWSDGINFVSKAVTITYNTVAGGGFAFGGDRGLFATGRDLSVGFYNYTDYFDITTPGNASEFGSPGTARSFTVGASNTTRGLTAGGFNSAFTNTSDIDYYTIASPGNATSFGSLSSAKYGMQAVSNGTYAVFAGGSDNEIQYVTIDTTGNTTDFGDLTAGSTPAGQHSVTDGSRGVFIHSSNTDSMQYITIASPGNAIDFGDMAVTGATAGSTSNTTMGLYANSGNIYKITIATTGNSVDWGYNVANTWTERNFGVITNNTRGIFAGGTQSTTGKLDIEYVTFDVPSNGTDFGDLGIARGYGSGFAGNAA